MFKVTLEWETMPRVMKELRCEDIVCLHPVLYYVIMYVLNRIEYNPIALKKMFPLKKNGLLTKNKK